MIFLALSRKKMKRKVLLNLEQPIAIACNNNRTRDIVYKIGNTNGNDMFWRIKWEKDEGKYSTVSLYK